jgi:hypothetical protein
MLAGPDSSQHQQEIPATLPDDGRYRKLKFTSDEDAYLSNLVATFGNHNWQKVASLMPMRNPRQCRERYNNYLDPAIRRDPWTAEEDAVLLAKAKELGPKWNTIGQLFVNRSDNALRNRWHQLMRRSGGEPESPEDVVVAESPHSFLEIFEPYFDPFSPWNGTTF